jgi:hypothetical protein
MNRLKLNSLVYELASLVANNNCEALAINCQICLNLHDNYTWLFYLYFVVHAI